MLATLTGYKSQHFLWQFTQGTKLRLYFGVVFTIAVAASESMIAALLQKIIDNGVVDQSQSFIQWIPWLVIGYFAFRSAVSYAADVLLAWVCSRIKKNIRHTIFHAIAQPFNDVPLAKHQHDINTNVFFGAENIGLAVTMGCTVLLKESVTLILLLAYMMWTSIELFILFVTAGPLVAWFVGFCNGKIREKHTLLQQIMASMSQFVEETCKGQVVLQVYRATTTSQNNLHKMNQDGQAIENKLNQTQALTNAVAQLVFGVPAAMAFYLYFNLGYMTQGAFIAFIFCAFRILQPIKLLARANADMQKALASLEQLKECLDKIEAPDTTLNTETVPGHCLTFKNVSIRNHDQQKCIVANIDMALKRGQSCAILGASGSGKSTLVRAILGLIAPQHGKISIDGMDISRLERSAFHSLFSYVGQDPHIFNGTIAENIALGDVKINQDRVLTAAKIANAETFIDNLDNKFETQITHHDKVLSGGQLQRINIARAVYKDAPIFILDEMTSALDQSNEATIIKNLKPILQDKIAIIITHRKTLLTLANTVWRLESGQLILDN